MFVKSERYIELVKKYPSVIGILISNALILFYAIFMGATSAEILLLYWFESAIIGFFNILKMAIVDWKFSSLIEIILFCLKFFLIPFFMVHYGIFMGVHFMFILVLTSGFMTTNYGGIFATFSQAIGMIFVPLIVLIISHLYSFIFNFVINGEYKKTNAPMLMMQPYPRIFVMQMTIIIGAFVSVSISAYFGQQYFQVGIISLFIIIKTYFDIKSHLKEREKNQGLEALNKLNNMLGS